MKTNFLTSALLLLSISGIAQSLFGAWEQQTTDDTGNSITNVVIFTDGYQVATWYHTNTGAFVRTNGGAWSMEGNTLTETIEFDSANPERVGTSQSILVKLSGDTLATEDGNVWKRVDDGTPGALQSAWLMSGRKRDGTIQTRDTSRPRKTMKILSGTRFQWIAYNTETKTFMATGGGTYTTQDGVYTENIEFFSRDASRVGVRLSFNYELLDGTWHHSGLSSKGQPIYEIWSVRE